MQHYTPSDDQIRTQFVTSLMNYFKIDEDVFLRSHIDELIRAIPISRYSEFLRQLSTRELPFKTGIEKISLIAQEMFEMQRSPLEHEAHERASKLYALMYDLRRMVSEEKNTQSSALERFENIRFTSIKQANTTEPLLDSLDIDVVKTLSKRWIYDYVNDDRGLFELRCSGEYLKALIEQQRLSTQPRVADTTRKVLQR